MDLKNLKIRTEKYARSTFDQEEDRGLKSLLLSQILSTIAKSVNNSQNDLKYKDKRSRKIE